MSKDANGMMESLGNRWRLDVEFFHLELEAVLRVDFMQIIHRGAHTGYSNQFLN